HGGSPVAGVEHDGLDVPVGRDAAVDVGLDVAVQEIVLTRTRRRHQLTDALGPAHGVGLEDRVRVAEGAASGHLRAQAEVCGAEAHGAPVGTVAGVEGAVDRTLPRVAPVVPAGEEPALPAPAVAAL